MTTALPWTPWATLDGAPRLNERTLAELLDGGQAFRWNRQPDGVWRGIWATHVVELARDPNGSLLWRTPLTLAGTSSAALRAYLGLPAAASPAKPSRGPSAHVSPLPVSYTDALPWRSDRHLANCLAAFPGLTLLRQPLAETLLCFLCSATKQIVQIKQMVELLAQRHGAPLIPGVHRLPTWDELARASEADLRLCLLGFRARYIHQTALHLAAHPGWLETVGALPYPEAKAALCTLPGVGEKVADCVLLFGAGKWEAFPVDVWILKTMERRYALAGWKPTQIAHFGRVHFGPQAGLAQQYLFAYERAQAAAHRSPSAPTV